jgi:hypothetical protein
MSGIKIYLMHILIIGPLLFGIGYKPMNNYMSFYKYLTGILLILPFMIHFPKAKPSEWGIKSWNNIIHLVIYLPFLGYVAYKKDNSPELVFSLLKIIGINVIAIHSYLFATEFIKKIKTKLN